MTTAIGINLGHDAGIGRCDPEGEFGLVEVDRVVRRRHACGGIDGVESALGAVLRGWRKPRETLVGITDYASPLAGYAAPVHAASASTTWECRGIPRPDQLVRELTLPSHFLGADWGDAPNSFLVRHHWAHAQLAYVASGFERSVVVVLDGVACFADCGLICVGEGDVLRPVGFLTNITGPRFGLTYEAFARKVFGSPFATGKVLGLAGYGTAQTNLIPALQMLIAPNRIRERHSVVFESVAEARLRSARLRYGADWMPYDAATGGFLEPRCKSYGDYLAAFGEKFPDAFAIGGEEYAFPADADDYRCRDVAATLQLTFEREITRFIQGLARIFPDHDRLCFAGGCALNIAANARLASETPFREVFIPSCCDDSGIALGTALAVSAAGRTSVRAGRTALAFSGTPLDGVSTLDSALAGETNVDVCRFAEEDELLERLAEVLRDGRALGWIHDRCETGPRSLGRRSLLASPMIPGMRARVSERIKGRESFRPLAPICTAEAAHRYFDGPSVDASTMLFQFRVRPSYRPLLSEVTHVDHSARLQTISSAQHPALHSLLRHFERRSGVPILINTSLNSASEPMVNSVSDALALLQRTDLDGLVFVDSGVLCLKRDR